MTLSFAGEVKREIYHNRQLRARHGLAQGYGLLLFGRHFSAREISLTTERKAIARLYASFLHETIGLDGGVTIRENKRGEETVVYTVSVDDSRDREKILAFFNRQPDVILKALFQKEGDLPAFLGGAYLACGNVTDPQKNYHLEFMVYNPALVEPLAHLLEELIAPPRHSERRGVPILYYRESEHIEDMLTAMGASKAALSMMEVKIYKDMRNKVNRVTNCETANIDKTVTAATAQVEDIRLILERQGEQSLPEELREVARLRLENPDLSLRELCEVFPGAISRSGMNHRLKRLSAMAEQIREKDNR